MRKFESFYGGSEGKLSATVYRQPGAREWRAAHSNENKEIYEGEVDLDGMRDGRGTCIYSDNRMYEGMWRNGWEHGQGLLTGTHNETVYEGGFQDGRISGSGKYHYKNGDTYEGQWKEGRRYGQGKLV